MYLDVKDLKSFYYRTKLGRIVQARLTMSIQSIWPILPKGTVVGFGFSGPVLRPYLKDSERVICLMPGPQGVVHWPQGEKNSACLISELNWPCATGSIDNLIIMHALENTDQPQELLEEAWRALSPSGRAIIIVPNRSGLWARLDKTPFGFGRPYSLGQLEAYLSANGFEVFQHRVALYAPPSHRSFGLRFAKLFELALSKISPEMTAGVVMVEVGKQVYAPNKPRKGALKDPFGLWQGIRTSKPKSARSKLDTKV